MAEFLLPDLGEGLTEAEIVRWLVSVGDAVSTDQPVVEVETAKVTVEVPVPFAGVVTALHGQPGDVVPVGAVLVNVNTSQASRDDAVGDGSGRVLVGYGTSSETTRRRRASSGPRADERAVAPSRRATPHVAVISPLVRRMARERGVDLGQLAGSGPQGIVLRRDVESAAVAGAERRIPVRGIRKAMADKVGRSRREIPEATVWVDVDATELVATRATLNARSPERPVSLLGLIARFAVIGLHRFPELNARVEKDDLVLVSAVHLGFAAQTERGLVVPVVRDAQLLSTRELSEQFARHTAAAREGRLSPGDLTGGTFTLNNYGVFGVDGSAAIINLPEVAILGFGRIVDRPWVVDGSLAVRKVTELTLAFDHRACDGGTAGGFLRFVADCIESPIVALGEL